MHLNNKYAKRTLAIMLTVIFTVVVVWWFFGVRFNHSPSVHGLFFRTTHYLAEKNSLVFICPNKKFILKFNISKHTATKGPCGGVAPLLKRLVALSGDDVLMGAKGILVNGNLIKNSLPLLRDGKGGVLPTSFFTGSVPAGHAIVLGDHPGSFDSRYYGLIKEQWITGQARRIF